MDTSLNLKYLGHTIDTILDTQIKTGVVKNTVTNATPTRVVNAKGYAHDGMLYILSKLKADNENETADDKATIDIYNLETGKYYGSVYIPYYKREKVTDFKLLKNKIIAAYKNYIVTYQFTLK